VRGPKHVVKTGKTPVLDAADWRKLLDSIPTDTVRDLRDRALIATLTYSFARITAALKMKVEDLRPQGAGWRLQLHEKGGKHHTMPCGARAGDGGARKPAHDEALRPHQGAAHAGRGGENKAMKNGQEPRGQIFLPSIHCVSLFLLFTSSSTQDGYGGLEL
jgi:integrase